MDFSFFMTSVGLGVGLAMDAFSVSLANGLAEPCMKKRKLCLSAGIFAFFQFAMPMIGWVCVHYLAQQFTGFQPFIPWIALALLGFIGGKMLVEGIRNREGEEEIVPAGILALMVQGVATSIDALSVGFTIADYDWLRALVSGLVIAVVTFAICVGGILLGKTFGTRLAGRASILGGVILIAIGIWIFVKGLIGI